MTLASGQVGELPVLLRLGLPPVLGVKLTGPLWNDNAYDPKWVDDATTFAVNHFFMKGCAEDVDCLSYVRGLLEEAAKKPTCVYDLCQILRDGDTL